MTHGESDLAEVAVRVREHVIRLAGRGGCFIGASLSCVDLLVYLYGEFLDISPDRVNDPDRDVVLLSKGHDVPALYGTLVEYGYLEHEALERHLDPGSHVYWHPNRAIPGVEFHSGSLGHLLPVAVGVAMGNRMAGRSNRTIVITGDGELNEGSNWEALLVAAAHGLEDLLVIVDRNGFQANLPTEALIPLEPLTDKFAAFGADVTRADGHDFRSMRAALSVPRQGRPRVVVADTVRGRGLPSLERRADRWFATFTDREVDELLRELHTGLPTRLTSKAQVVR